MNGQLNVLLLGGRASTIARLALYVVGAAPIVVAFTFVSVYGVNVPYLDDWTAVDLFKKVSAGSLAFSDFIADYSGHRILVPRLVFVGLAPLTHWNLVSELYVIQAANVLLLALLLAAARRNVANWMFPLTPFLSFLVFTPRLQETWFFGFHISWAFVPAFGVLTLYLLELLKTRRRRRALFAGALVAATITTFSLLPGIMIWPAGFVQLLLMRARPWAKRLTIVWTAAGALELGAYFLHWTVGGYRQGLTYNLVHPLKGLDFIATLLGSSLFYTNRSALIGGILLAFAGVATLVLLLRHRRSFESSFWTAVCVFALLMTLEIASGRSGLGAGWAVISRYAVAPRLLVVGLLMLLVTMARVQRSRVSAALAVALAGLLCASAAITYPHVIELAPQARAQREWAAWVLANYRWQPAEFLSVIRYPPGVIAPAEPLRDSAAQLEQRGYSVFADHSAPRPPSGPPSLEKALVLEEPSFCVIDSVGGMAAAGTRTIVIPPANPLTVSGWCRDQLAGDVAGGVYVVIDGRPYPAFARIERPDVQLYFGSETYLFSGFEALVPRPRESAHRHTVSLVALSHNKRERFQETMPLSFTLARSRTG